MTDQTDTTEILEDEEETQFMEMAEDTMIGALMDVGLQEIKALPKSWPELSENGQDLVITRLENAVRISVRKAIRILVNRDMPTVVAQVEGITRKADIKATLKIDRTGFHELGDRVGSYVTIILADAAEYDEQPHSHEPEPDQGQLDVSVDTDTPEAANDQAQEHEEVAA